MITYSNLSKRPKIFRTFTGLTIQEFNAIYQTIKNNYKEYENKRLDRPDRINKICQGRKPKLGLIDCLLMLLYITGCTSL
ncbi:MAG: hypothetical protein SVM80_07620 [Halobacteriota archaeon]|nr:hypothetical protein [Halobacteriota archaeon]